MRTPAHSLPFTPAALLGLAIWLGNWCGTTAAGIEAVSQDEFTLIRVPAGQFWMGTSDEARASIMAEKSWTRFNECERPAHRVTIARPFLISKYEVTQKQWKKVLEKNPSAFKGDDLPVDSVSWNDIQRFLKKLQETTGRKYRLPTEAEWEYACRAGGTNRFALGEGKAPVTSANLGEYAWFRSNSDNRTHPVGQKKPNAWGLCDMFGNVWEWCEDWYAEDFYSQSEGSNPVNKDVSSERVLRGGSWFLDGAWVRPACRSGNWPDFRSQYAGFRLALDLEEGPES